jgi:hypothetical protein
MTTASVGRADYRRTATARSGASLWTSVTAHVPLAEAADAVNRLEKKIGDPIRLELIP